MTPNLYGAWLTAGDNLQPYGAWLAHNWPNLAIAASIAYLGYRIIRWSLRDTRHLPAAPDNIQPTDEDALIECRRIHRLEVRDPETPRRVWTHLRDKGEL